MKLFGTTIPLPADGDFVSGQRFQSFSDPNLDLHPSINSSPSSSSQDINCCRIGDDKKASESELTSEHEDASSLATVEELIIDPATSSCENQKTTSVDNEPSTPQENTLKKPGKVVPCPRCSSGDTKFCYYNNYNFNQPRHFCRKCHRYWTSGGTTRNVPVGSGRRKNNKASNSRQLLAAEAMIAAAIADSSNTNGTVLEFGLDSQSSISVGSSISSSNSSEKVAKESPVEHFQGFSPQSPWHCPWTPASPFGPPGFPVTFIPPPPYWGGCALPGMPWFFLPQPTISSGPTYPILGKHSRDGNILKKPDSVNEEPLDDGHPNRKTMRIHDPCEVAESSIWLTLGNKNEGKSSPFKAFQSRDEQENHLARTSLVLQANPAALSLSLNFREST